MALAAKAPVTITWLVRTDPIMNPWERTTIRQFEHLHPGIRVQLIISPSGAPFDEKLLTMNAAGTPPDVFSHWGSDGWADFQYRGLLANLTPYIKKSHFSFQGMNMKLVHQYSIGNKIYGIPFATGGSYLFYNEALFKRAHLPLPPTNWNDKQWNLATLMRDAKKLTIHGKSLATTQYGLEDTLWPENANLWLWGGDFFLPSAYKTGLISKVTALSPAAKAAVTWQRNLIFKDKVAPTPAESSLMSKVSDPFTTGKIGMDLTGVWGFWTLLPSKFPWGIAPLPYIKTDKDVLFTDPWMMAKNAKNKSAAWTFIQYLSNPQLGDKSYTLTAGTVPPWKQLLPVWAKHEHQLHPSMTEPQLINLALGSMSHGQESINHLGIDYGQFDSTITNVLEPVWTGKTTPLAALKALQSQLTNVIREAGITHGR